MKLFSCYRWLVLGLLLVAMAPGRASTLQVSPTHPQPGDVLTLTVSPAAHETIARVEMDAFDTPVVKFYPRGDGSQRAFLGVPYDRAAGLHPIAARVVTSRAGRESVEVLTIPLQVRGRVFPTQYVTMDPATAAHMGETAALHQEKLLVQSTMQNSSPAPLWRGSWWVPCAGRSTSSYGRRRYVNGRWWGQHSGADIRASTGTPVHASNSGRVVLSQYLPTLRGNCIVVDHGCNVFSVYMHLSRRLASVGSLVERGQVIGLVGATGFVTGPHLHWEIRIGWEPVDPFNVVRDGLQF